MKKSLLILFSFSFLFTWAQNNFTSSIDSCNEFVSGPNSTWTNVLVATTIADGASSQTAQTFTMNVTSLPSSGANVRVYKTIANGSDFFGNPVALTLGSNSITVPAVTFDRAVKFQFSSGDVEFDVLSLNGFDTECIVPLPPPPFTLISDCDDFVSGPAAWPYVLVATTVAEGAASQAAQTFTMNVTSLPAGGANVRVYKTTANGNDYFGNPVALTLGSNSITVPAVTFDRAVKFQFSSGDVEFDALSLNGVDTECVVPLPPPPFALISDCDDFVSGPTAWPYVLIATTIADGASSQAAQTYTMNVTSLPVGGANVRVYKTTANGNDFFGNPVALTLGSNSITVPAVTFDRAVKFQFSSGDVEFDALSLNGIDTECICISTTSTDLIVACDNYTWIDGNTYFSSNNSVTHILVSNSGCDSVVTLDLTITTSTYIVDIVEACDTYTWIDGNIYTTSNNTATHTISSNSQQNLLMEDFESWPLSNNGWSFQSFDANGASITPPAGSWNFGATAHTGSYSAYHDWWANATGAYPAYNDWMVSPAIDLTNAINPHVSFWQYTLWAANYAFYHDVSVSTVDPSSGAANWISIWQDLNIGSDMVWDSVSIDLNSFLGQTIWIGFNYQGQDGTEWMIDDLTVNDIPSCDTIFTLDLTITSSSFGIDIIEACDSYTWIDGNTYTTSNNTATYTLVSSSGCDSIVTLDLTITSSSFGIDIIEACDSYTWIDGNTYATSNNTATYTLANTLGCDSIVALDLTITTVDAAVMVMSDSSLQAQLLDAGATYQWVDCNNNFAVISGETNSIFSTQISGDYAVEVTINDCSALSDCYNIYNNVNVDVYNTNYAIQLFPNPTKNDITVSLKGVKYVDIIIFDIHGKVMLEQSCLLDRDLINISYLAAGTYFVKIISSEESKIIRVSKY